MEFSSLGYTHAKDKIVYRILQLKIKQKSKINYQLKIDKATVWNNTVQLMTQNERWNPIFKLVHWKEAPKIVESSLCFVYKCVGFNFKQISVSFSIRNSTSKTSVTTYTLHTTEHL
jgi:hypothetical protein